MDAQQRFPRLWEASPEAGPDTTEAAPLPQLAEWWRQEAERFRRRGGLPLAATLESCAQDLEEGLREWRSEQLDLDQASVESGYSREHLGRLVRNGTIPNAGEPNAPRIRRRDLPRKPGYGAGRSSGPKPVESRTQIVRSIVESD